MQQYGKPDMHLPAVLAGLGALSGLISTAIAFLNGFAVFGGESSMIMRHVSLLPVSAFPGFVFALLTGRAISRRYAVGDRFYTNFLLASTGCCWVASTLGILLIMVWSDGGSEGAAPLVRLVAKLLPELWQIGALCGLLGGGLLAVITRRLSPALQHFYVPLPAIVGALSGAVLFPMVMGLPVFGVAIFFVGWQALYAGSVGMALFRVRK